MKMDIVNKNIDEVNASLEIIFVVNKKSKNIKDKNYQLSDKIRDELSDMGVSLMDSANGTVWEI